MHFVKKLATSDEQKAKRDKERAEKLKIYCKLREKIFAKRKNGELDEELLFLTASLLEKNPDIYTFWNIRRQVISLLSEKLPNESAEENVKKKDSLLEAELLLTQTCLKTNCKSYGAWFHRFWSLKQISKYNINDELTACEKLLQMDERNFHCWNYRRQLVKFASQSAEEELRFSERLINKNFSNYSAWHYRSILLPQLFPDPKKELIVKQETLNDEYRKLQNAFFLDPEDQSAWIYVEWLLISDPRRLKSDIKDTCVLGLICDVIPNEQNGSPIYYISIAFDHIVNLSSIADFLIIKLRNGEKWIPVSSMKMANSRVNCFNYRFEIANELVECQLRPSFSEPFIMVDLTQGYVNFKELYHYYHIRRKPIDDARQQFIEKLIHDCRTLIEEHQAERKRGILKWPLFIHTLALLELKPIENHETILRNFEDLAVNIDPQRCEMYEQMAMDVKINERLRQTLDDGLRIDVLFKKKKNHFIGELELDELGLKSLEHLKYLSLFLTRLDLTGNKFTSLRQFKSFKRLTHLYLDRNPISSLEGISLLPSLEYLSVTEFPITNLDKKDEEAMKSIETVKLNRR